MADTIARLIFQAETKELQAATNRLKEIGKVSKSTASSVRSLNKAFNDQHKALKGELQTTSSATQKRKEFGRATKNTASEIKRSTVIVDAQGNALKKLKDTESKVTQGTQKNTEATKIANAVRRAEIKAYQENAKRKEKAASASNKLTKKEKELTKTNEKLANSFRNASTATAALQGPLNGLSGRLSFIATGLGRIGVSGLAASASFVGLAFAIRNSLQVFQEYELQMMKVEALVKSTGGTAGFTSNQLNEMAVGLATATMASANEMRNAQGILLTFKAISGDVFESALGLTVDIGAAMGQTASSGAKQLGKALEDPARNMTGLTRAGISFTAQEKERITVLQRSGDLQGAQAVIIKTLQDQLGGAGTGGGLAGAADLVADNFERLNIAIAEEFGFAGLATRATMGLANALGFLADKITETPEEELARLLGTNTRSSSSRGGRSKNVDFSKTSSGEPATKQASSSRGGRSKDVEFDPLQARIKELQDIIAEEEKAQAAAAVAAEANQVRIKEEARIEREILAENMNLKVMELEEHNLRIQGFEEEANLLKFERLTLQNDLELEAARKKHGDLEELERIHQNTKNNIITEQNLAEMKIADKRHKLKKKGDKQALDDTKKFLGFMGEHSKKAFKVKKMIDIADAIVSGHKAATDAYAAGMSTGGPTAPAVAKAYMAASIAATGAKIAAIKSTTFSGGGGSGGGGGVGGAAAADAAPIQPAANDEVVAAPQAINVTVDGSIDPTGARRIIEAINEATEDGLEINALVGT
jgi:hypothetical protein